MTSAERRALSRKLRAEAAKRLIDLADELGCTLESAKIEFHDPDRQPHVLFVSDYDRRIEEREPDPLDR